MKKTVTILLMTLHAVLVFGQVGFTPTFFGDFYKRDLANPANATLIGTTQNQIGASDFGSDGILYAISGADNGLYSIDTSNANATFIAPVNPPGSEFWSGMACDPTDGTMYICSTDGNTGSLYTIDLAAGTTTLVGSINAADPGVVGIAFDNTGQMYGIMLVRKFYRIDKTTGEGTFVGNFDVAVSALPHHGLDFDPVSETMYMVSYNAFTFDNELWIVDPATGADSLVGSVGIWTGTLAVAPPMLLAADFTADTTALCEGGMVNYTDMSVGNPDAWLWTFEGGDPETSTEQNPVVSYATEGVFDVSLEIYAGSSSNSVQLSDFITVYTMPTPAISGDDTVCAYLTSNYSTIGNPGNSYEWSVEGGEIVNGSGTSQITVEWQMQGSGTVLVTESSDYCIASSEIFEVFIDPCVLVPKNKDHNKRLIPNPASSQIRIDISGLQAIAIKIIDSRGKIMSNTSVSNSSLNQMKVDISQFPDGIYFLQLTSANGNFYSWKFIKTK